MLPAVSDENPGGIEAQAIEETVAPQDRHAYRRHIQILLARGYSPSLELAETGYTLLRIQRLRATIEEARAAETDTTKQTWEALQVLESSLQAQLKGLDARQKSIATVDPDRELRAAELFVQEHLGEFTERCPSCAAILTVPALPHWAYAPVSTEQGPVPMVWSPELWALVMDRTISLWVMAFTLRTSPEALHVTCLRRGELWPEWIDIEAEEAALAVRLTAMDRQALQASIGAPS